MSLRVSSIDNELGQYSCKGPIFFFALVAGFILIILSVAVEYITDFRCWVFHMLSCIFSLGLLVMLVMKNNGGSDPADQNKLKQN